MKKYRSSFQDYDIEETMLENRKTESYSTLDLIYMGVFFYRECFLNWDLKKEGYILKHKQRRRAIFIGFVVYLAIILWTFQGANKMEEERLHAIDQLAMEDSLMLATINWTANYEFDESKFDKNASILWLLSVKKKNLEHDFNLVIYKDNQPILDIDGFAGITKDGLKMILNAVNFNKTDMVFSNYDKLFEFVVDNNDTIVFWNKLKPMEMKEVYNGYKYFNTIH